MSAGSKKRKRDDGAADRLPKVRVVEASSTDSKTQPDSKSRGLSRQAKSERRSKMPSKKPGLLTQAKKLSKREPDLLTSYPTPSNEDNIANGEDFVSLSVDSGPASLTPRPNENVTSGGKLPAKSKPRPLPPQTSSPAPANKNKSKKERFILFIGNLPYAATTSSITAHFNTLQPFTVRHSTDKTTGRSKGFAFLEFGNYDKMKTCLKLYHHSIFDPDDQMENNEIDSQQEGGKKRSKMTPGADEGKEAAPKSKNARRINVELTAGGGGKGKQRKEKIHEKNKKLAEERERRHIRDAAERAKAGQQRKERPATGANADQETIDARGQIHPSRLRRVKH